VISHLVGPALAPSPFTTVGEALRSAARGVSGLRLVDAREEERFVTWQEVDARARRVAAALLELGVAQGDRVAMVLPTGLDFMDAFFGTLLAGAVPVPLYPPVRLGRMDEYAASTARMLVASGARVVLTDRRVRLLLGRALDEARPALGCRVVAELVARTNEADVQSSSSALGLIQFSSGSTVDPKPVALTHANLLAQTTALKTLMPERPGTHEKGCSWLPLYHDMGLIGGLLTAVTWPGELVLLPPEAFLARPALWLRTISRHQATISPAPNFAYGLCLKRVRDDDLEGVDLSSWTYALNGAEPISSAVMERFCERFGRVGFRREALAPVYGLSEASLAVTFSPARAEPRVARVDAGALARSGQVAPGRQEVVSVGVPVPGCEVEVRDDEQRALPEGRVGRIVVRGASVMREYFGRPDATGEALRDGWLDTGDLGFVDRGELHVCGRAKDVVIIRGANHAPRSSRTASTASPACGRAARWRSGGCRRTRRRSRC
jgi:acyl-CoA synthetase (AMP-forming)/AMP-acid ligase II